MSQREIPFVRLSSALVLGIWVADRVHESSLVPAIVVLILLSSVVIGARASKKGRGFLILACLFIGGFARHSLVLDQYQKSAQIEIPERSSDQWIQLIEAERSSATHARFTAIWTDRKHIAQGAQRDILVLVRIEKSDSLTPPAVGDIVAGRGRLRTIDAPPNPAAFDYGQFLARKGIFHQLTFRAGNWRLVQKAPSMSYLAGMARWRLKLQAVFEKYLPTPDHRSLAMAISLGFKKEMDPKLYQSFADTGAVHILAVSGLHVGMLSLILFYLLRFVPNRLVGGMMVKTILIIASLWVYAVITQAGPSVYRATTMITIVLAGRYGLPHRHFNTYNALAFAAFVLLIHNPNALFSLSFQFSFLALLGILAFQKPISQLWRPPWRWFDHLWQLTTVSIAAQILVFPIAVGHFHQFPIYFWLSSLMAIPFGFVILAGGLLLLLLESMHLFFAAEALAHIYDFIIALFLAAIRWIEQLPMARLDLLSLDQSTIYMTYTLIGAIWIWTYNRRFIYLCIGLCCTLAISVKEFIEYAQETHRRELVVFHVYNKSLIDLYIGRRYTSFRSGITERDERFAANGYRTKKQAIHPIVAHDPMTSRVVNTLSYPLWLIGDASVLRLDRFTDWQRIPRRVMDVVILTDNCAVRIEDLMERFECQIVVADGSNHWRQVDRWAKTCHRLGIPFHATARNGAFIHEL